MIKVKFNLKMDLSCVFMFFFALEVAKVVETQWIHVAKTNGASM